VLSFLRLGDSKGTGEKESSNHFSQCLKGKKGCGKKRKELTVFSENVGVGENTLTEQLHRQKQSQVFQLDRKEIRGAKRKG